MFTMICFKFLLLRSVPKGVVPIPRNIDSNNAANSNKKVFETRCIFLIIDSVVFSLGRASLKAIDGSFPPGFKFGTSSAAYQVEGAWNVSDKRPSIWDHFTHDKPGAIVDNSNGDVATDSYHQWKRDIDMACELGLDFYRFSISWPRLLPNGFSNKISEDGKNYYNNLINGLLQKGIQPLVTLYHWDLPQNLQDLGGWTNPHITDYFEDYARVVFSLYADRVKLWITINEPVVMCDLTFVTGIMAPGLVEPVVAPFLCNKHVLIAHAKAWRIYHKEFKPKYHGKVSISNHIIWFEPKNPKEKNLSDLAMEFTAGRYSHPIYSKKGDWPLTIKRFMAEDSRKRGYSRSRLPPFTKEEIKLIRGTYDFMGLNYYTSKLVRSPKPGEVVDPFLLSGIPDLNLIVDSYPNDTHGHNELMTVHPKGLRELLTWLKKTYGDIEILITENGYSTAGHDLKDVERISFIKSHLEQILLSIKKDGVHVSGYTYWTLMDNFEWMSGYTFKFGLYEVDFADPQRKRTPRASAQYFANVTRHRSLDI